MGRTAGQPALSVVFGGVQSQREPHAVVRVRDAHIVVNIAEMISRCTADPVAKMSDLPTTGDLVESDSPPAVSLRSASTFSQLG